MYHQNSRELEFWELSKQKGFWSRLAIWGRERLNSYIPWFPISKTETQEQKQPSMNLNWRICEIVEFGVFGA
jgi:hypothetical protein